MWLYVLSISFSLLCTERAAHTYIKITLHVIKTTPIPDVCLLITRSNWGDKIWGVETGWGLDGARNRCTESQTRSQL